MKKDYLVSILKDKKLTAKLITLSKELNITRGSPLTNKDFRYEITKEQLDNLNKISIIDTIGVVQVIEDNIEKSGNKDDKNLKAKVRLGFSSNRDICGTFKYVSPNQKHINRWVVSIEDFEDCLIHKMYPFFQDVDYVHGKGMYYTKPFEDITGPPIMGKDYIRGYHVVIDNKDFIVDLENTRRYSFNGLFNRETHVIMSIIKNMNRDK